MDEVEGNGKKIKTISIAEAKEKGLVISIDEDVDQAYQEAVCAVLLLAPRDSAQNSGVETSGCGLNITC